MRNRNQHERNKLNMSTDSCPVNDVWSPAYSGLWVGFGVKKWSKQWVRGPCLHISVHGKPPVSLKHSVIARIMVRRKQLGNPAGWKAHRNSLSGEARSWIYFFSDAHLATGMFDLWPGSEWQRRELRKDYVPWRTTPRPLGLKKLESCLKRVASNFEA